MQKNVQGMQEKIAMMGVVDQGTFGFVQKLMRNSLGSTGPEAEMFAPLSYFILAFIHSCINHRAKVFIFFTFIVSTLALLNWQNFQLSSHLGF